MFNGMMQKGNNITLSARFSSFLADLGALRLGAESEVDRDTLGPLPLPSSSPGGGLVGPPWGPFAGAPSYLGPGAFLPLGYAPSSAASHGEGPLASYVNYAREGSAHSGSGGSGGGGANGKEQSGGNHSDSEGASQRSGGGNSSNSDPSTRMSQSREPQQPPQLLVAPGVPPPLQTAGSPLEAMPHDLTVEDDGLEYHYSDKGLV